MDRVKMEKILNMPIKEANLLIAKEIFGYHVYHYDKDYKDNCYYILVDLNMNQVAPYWNGRKAQRKTEEEAWNDCPDFFKDMNNAWEVYLQIMKGFHSQKEKFYKSLQQIVGRYSPITWEYPEVFTMLREDMPNAICRAALMTVLD